MTRAVKRGCGSPAVLAAALDLDTPAATFRAPGAAPLARTSAIVHMLESAAGPLRVHPADPSSFFELLPEDEAAWVVETAADAVVPVPGPGGELLGVLAVGRRFDDRLVRPDDLPFIQALGAGAGLALGRLSLMGSAGDSSPEASPAEECPECGCVVEAGGAPECGCGTAYAEAEVPKLLAGKFQVTRRLGAGGMGTAYLARDLRLERNVAVKTLTGLSALTGLKPEAWAMAELSHPAVAQIHAIESWRGRPFLVAEYLAGGTLANRLTRGPLPEREAISVAGTLAGALAALHEAGYLHGDVKPGNIGFTAGGSPKLLDFGLAREANDAGMLGGTLRYASPEVLAGRPGRGGRRRLVAGRGALRDGHGRASLRPPRGRPRRRDAPHPAPARRSCWWPAGSRTAIAGGRLRGVGAVGPAAVAARDRGGVRGSASRRSGGGSVVFSGTRTTLPGCGGFFIGIAVLPPSVVVDPLDIVDVRIFEAENEPPVGLDGARSVAGGWRRRGRGPTGDQREDGLHRRFERVDAPRQPVDLAVDDEHADASGDGTDGADHRRNGCEGLDHVIEYTHLPGPASRPPVLSTRLGIRRRACQARQGVE